MKKLRFGFRFSLAISKIKMIFQPYLLPWYHSWSEKQSRPCEYFRNNLLRGRYYFWRFALQNHHCPVSLPSKIEIIATPSERPLPNSLSYFTQENWFWKWFWKTIGEVDLDFKWAASLRKSIFIIINRKPWQKNPSHQTSCKWLLKFIKASSMLNLSRESEVCLAFFFCQEQGYRRFQIKSHHMRKIFRSVLHSLLRAYALKQASCLKIWQQTSLSWKDFSAMERQDYHRMAYNSSPPSRPESTPEMVAPTTGICVTPSVR